MQQLQQSRFVSKLSEINFITMYIKGYRTLQTFHFSRSILSYIIIFYYIFDLETALQLTITNLQLTVIA